MPLKAKAVLVLAKVTVPVVVVVLVCLPVVLLVAILARVPVAIPVITPARDLVMAVEIRLGVGKIVVCLPGAPSLLWEIQEP